MPEIATEDFVPWANYHLSVGRPLGFEPEPQVEVERMGRVLVADQEGMGIERFCQTAKIVCEHLKNICQLLAYKKQQRQLGKPPLPLPLALTGRAWSFSNVIGAPAGKPCMAMLIADGLTGIVKLTDDEKCRDAPEHLVLAGAGTRFAELAAWAERQAPRLSIINSGTYLGMTLAGAIGTASHGGRLDRGGLHDMVHGLHIVTGIGDSVWIERESRPVLPDAAIAQLGANRTIRDDCMFADALVHLGCMGIINAVAIELEPEQRFVRLHLDRKIDATWLATLAQGDWNSVGRAFGCSDAPVFYELTIDPSNWDGPSALHIAYFTADAASRATTAQPLDDGCCLATADAICRFGADSCQTKGAVHNECRVTGPASTAVDLCVLLPSATEKSVFERYGREGRFADPPCIRSGNWKALHQGAITGGHPGALWNASFAIKRADLPRAIPAICAAVAGLPQSFVFTVRFVKGDEQHGIEFTRFGETAVIEIDGLSPWICQKVTQRWQDAMGGSTAGIEDRLDLLSRIERTLPLGAARMATALRNTKIEFSNHWGKLGHIDSTSVHAAFGDPATPHSRLGHWRQTRNKLLTSPLAKAIFWNWGAVHMGLIDQPSQMP